MIPWILSSLGLLLPGWDAPPACISQQELSASLEGEASPEAARRSIHGKAVATSDGWRFTLKVHEDGSYLGERVLELEGHECRAHDDALQLVLQLLLEHGPPESSEAPPPDEPSEDSPPGLAEDSTSDQQGTDSPPRWRGRALASLRLSTGWAPGASWGPEIGLGVGYGDVLWFDALGHFEPARSFELQETALTTQGGGMRLRMCGEKRLNWLWADLCPAVGWQTLSVAAPDLTNAQSARLSSTELGVDALVGASWRGAGSLFIGGSLGVPLVTGRFVSEGLQGEELLFSTQPVTFAGTMGAALWFP